MTLIKELIHIPKKVQRSDFVLNLASGLEPAAIDQTLNQAADTLEKIEALLPWNMPQN